MSVVCGFYDSIEGDRVYNSSQFSSMFDGMFDDGIFSDYGNRFFVQAEEGLSVSVDTGKAWFNQTWTVNDETLLLSLDAAHLSFSRIDAVVIETNKSASIRENVIKIVSGNPSSNPLRPALIHEGDVDQYALAYITVLPGATSISQNNIENVVGTLETPFVSGNLIAYSEISEVIYDEIKDRFKDTLISKMYPVGSIYMSVEGTNPSRLFGGTWENISGRFLIGAGTATDDNDEERTFLAGEENGTMNHTLTVNEMPSHTHTGAILGTVLDHVHKYEDSYDLMENRSNRGYGSDGQSGVARMRGSKLGEGGMPNNPQRDRTTSSAGNHTHSLSLNASGDSLKHNNLPPYFAVYTWKRVA